MVNIETINSVFGWDCRAELSHNLERLFMWNILFLKGNNFIKKQEHFFMNYSSFKKIFRNKVYVNIVEFGIVLRISL